MSAADRGPFDDISVSKAGAVIEVMLNRPDRLNPISARVGGTRDQIVQAITAAEDDPEIGCVLLLGAGRAFSAGGDVIGNEPRETPAEQIAFLEMSEAFHRRLRAARLPLIAAVHGYCLGAAMSLVASCDLVIAAASARFGLPEGRMGLIGASALVPIVGRQWTKFLIFTGELIDAEAARELGLVLSVEPDELLLERARDLAGRLTRMPRQAVLLNKRTVDAVADASGDAAGRNRRGGLRRSNADQRSPSHGPRRPIVSRHRRDRRHRRYEGRPDGPVPRALVGSLAGSGRFQLRPRSAGFAR